MSLNLSKEEILSFFKNEALCFQLLNNQLKIYFVGINQKV